VLVTGGAGFIGSHLVPALVDQGHEVAVVDNLSTGRVENLDERAAFHELDMNDDALAGVFEEHRPEAVYMLAFNTNVPLSVRDPVLDSGSITGSLRTLDLARQHGASKVVFASSSFAYGNAEELPTPETHPIIPSNPYVISKSATENYVRFFHEAHGLDAVIFRYATTYGPRQTGGAMADYIRSIHAGGAAKIYGDGSKTRDYTFVGDIVNANLMALDYSFPAGVVPVLNLGTGTETSLVELYGEIAKLLGRPDAKPEFEPDRPGEIMRSALDNSRAAEFLGWRPQVSLVDGLRATVDHYVSTLASAR
jgi:UDP-glucose 4-epimerase